LSLAFTDRWIWDFWHTKDGPDFHIFYLQAPKTLGDPDERHWHATIGHAVSADLQSWEILPAALIPSIDEAAWDSYATWTGSVIQSDALWYMFYTGVSHKEKGLVQRIGLAISKDLVHWSKFDGNPILVSDPELYEQLDIEIWHDQAWRDPWILKSISDNAFYAYITTRVNHGPEDGRGVITRAKSTNLIDWEIMNPVTEPGDFGHMEIPQVKFIHGYYYLFFSATKDVFSQKRILDLTCPPVTGTHYLVGENPGGPFKYLVDEFFVGDSDGSRYGGKLIEVAEEEFVLLTMRHFDSTGEFIGELDDPIPVEFGENGEIRLVEC
jgi:beta-fructofuranosidase